MGNINKKNIAFIPEVLLFRNDIVQEYQRSLGGANHIRQATVTSSGSCLPVSYFVQDEERIILRMMDNMYVAGVSMMKNKKHQN